MTPLRLVEKKSLGSKEENNDAVPLFVYGCCSVYLRHLDYKAYSFNKVLQTIVAQFTYATKIT